MKCTKRRHTVNNNFRGAEYKSIRLCCDAIVSAGIFDLNVVNGQTSVIRKLIHNKGLLIRIFAFG